MPRSYQYSITKIRARETYSGLSVLVKIQINPAPEYRESAETHSRGGESEFTNLEDMGS
jgi:hypothetical protein